MSDDIGSVMLDEEEELIAPDVPIKANPAIPVAIGILLILGSLVGSLLAATSAYVFYIDDEFRAAAGYDNETNASIDMMVESGIATVSVILYSAMSIGLLISGVLLFRKNPFGVKLGVISASLFVLTNLITMIWQYFISEDYGFESSIGTEIILFFACGLFCMTLPLIPILMPEGKAALYREPVVLSLSEEE
jgi:hypothetical protein